MFKIMKYLGEFKASAAAVILLLILQAYCDLSLPSYTSDIVDVGIEQGGIENAVLHSQGKNALHVGSRLFIEAGGKVFVEKLVGTHVIAFVGINAGEGAQQNGKGAVTLTFHDAAHQTVVHEVCVQGEIVKSPFFDSGHGLMIRG